jgi:type IV pilus assembly protein PilZ
METSSGSERREYPRRHIELKVEYKRLNAFFSDYTKNISKGGTFIRTNRPLDVGTEFVFKLFIPKLDEPLAIRGEVKWVITEEDCARGAAASPDGESSLDPGMGIRFVYREDDERRAIERTVEKLMIDSLGQLLYSKLTRSTRGG